MDEGPHLAGGFDGYDALFLVSASVVEGGEGIERGDPAEVIDAPCVDKVFGCDRVRGFCGDVDQGEGKVCDAIAWFEVLELVEFGLDLAIWRCLDEGDGVLLFGFTSEAEEVGLVGVEDEVTGVRVVGCSVEGERDGRGVRLALPEHVMVLDEGFGAGGCGWLRKRLGGSRVERDLWMLE